MLELTVPPYHISMPVKEFLRQAGLSLTLRRKIKHHGSLTCNGHPVGWNDPIVAGDRILLTWPISTSAAGQQINLIIPYEDEHLLIVDKPAGLLAHPTARHEEPSLANAVMYHYQTIGQAWGFHPVQRLDRQTSGLLLVAKHSHIQHLLSGRHLRRVYLALVTGRPDPPDGTVDAPLARKPGSIIERMVHPSGQQAITDYRLIAGNSAASLLEITLHTGRTHQIRVHMSHIGHPLLGDDLYGGARTVIDRQALHAASLSLSHPITGETIQVNSPLPDDMRSALRSLHLPDSLF